MPDVPTVRAQLGETMGDEHPYVWFPTTALSSPAEFAGYLENVSEFSNKQSASKFGAMGDSELPSVSVILPVKNGAGDICYLHIYLYI